MSYKIDKYLIKMTQNCNSKESRTKYLHKLTEHVIKQSVQTGGIVYDFNKISKPTNVEDVNYNIDQILNLLGANTKNKLRNTQNKYVVILMGTPGAGKSIARKIATKIIANEEFMIFEGTDVKILDDLFNSFVDISIDDFVYGSNIDGKGSGSDRLKKTMAAQLGFNDLNQLQQKKRYIRI